MSRTPFDPPFEALPEILPIFPLTGALLLPGGQLPLNIFEPRYLNMVGEALAGDRMIGMLQPSHEDNTRAGVIRGGGLQANLLMRDPDTEDHAPEVYRTGCAGRMVGFAEAEGGRYLITLQGLIRFDIAGELPGLNGYRRVTPDYAPYRGDLEQEEAEIDRDGLIAALREYFEATGIAGDWKAIEKAPNERLVTTLAMGCPFEPPEKQALLEAKTLVERSRIITAMLEMASHGDSSPGANN